MMTVCLTPLCKRAKDRVAVHGSKMELVKKDHFRGEDAIFVRSLNETSFGKCKWFGWFTMKEVKIESETVSV